MASSDDDHSRAMGPDTTTHSLMLSVDHAPVFITNQTNKLKHRDLIIKWSTMIRLIATSDPKAVDRLHGIGLMIYLSIDDDDAKECANQSFP